MPGQYTYTFEIPGGWTVVKEQTVITDKQISFTVEAPIGDVQTTITFDRDFSANNSGLVGIGKGWPIVSQAMAVHPQDVDKVRAECDKAGVPTDFDPSGAPIMRDRGHRRAYMQAFGLYDYSGGYGDNTP